MVKAKNVIALMQTVTATPRICTKNKVNLKRKVQQTLKVSQTLLGSSSVVTTNGSGIIPRDAMKITRDKLMIGIHPKLLKSTPDSLRYKYVARTMKKRAEPMLEIVNNV